MSTVEQQVKKIVAEQLGVKEEEVTNDASFVDDLGADSLDTVELVMALEEEFETEIPDEDAEKITTVQQVKKIVAEQLGVKEEEVTNDASFVDDLGADSLDTVELVMALEEEFETEIPDEDAEKITTVQQAIDYINSHKGKA